MKYPFIQVEKAHDPVGLLCQLLVVAPEWLLCVVPTPDERLRTTESMADDTHSDRLPRLAGTVWESADSPGSAGARVPGGPSSRRETDVAPCHPQCQPPPDLESPRGPP